MTEIPQMHPAQELGNGIGQKRWLVTGKRVKTVETQIQKVSLPLKSRAVIFSSCWTLSLPLYLVGVSDGLLY